MPREVIDYKALAERMKDLAEWVEEYSHHMTQDVDDLRTVVTTLNEAAAARPVAWIDEFGNAFPLDAWKPAKRTGYLDYHKKAWKPLFTYPAPQPQPEQHCAHERFGVAGNVFDSRGVARPYSTDTTKTGDDWKQVAIAQDAKLRAMCDEPGGLEKLRTVLAQARSEPSEARIAWPVRADEGMLRAMLSWRECDERDGLSGEASMFDRVYHALYSHMRDRAALAAKGK